MSGFFGRGRRGAGGEGRAEDGRTVARLQEKVRRLERQNAVLRRRLAETETGSGGTAIDARNVVWVFGAGRTGSSWLTFMMGAMQDHTRWNEPLVGYLFGSLYYERAYPRRGKAHFILADEYRSHWLAAARDLVLVGGATRFPERIDGGYLVIKEPHGSLGAPLLLEALPESRMISLVRDPRDVISSVIAASYIPTARDQRGRIERVEQDPVGFVADHARGLARDMARTAEAFEGHGGPKVRVRYEDLRADALGSMRRIYSELGIPVDDERLARVVRRRSWENVAEEMKGPDKRRRKATPGGWQEELSPEQVRVVERICAPVLEEFYRG